MQGDNASQPDSPHDEQNSYDSSRLKFSLNLGTAWGQPDFKIEDGVTSIRSGPVFVNKFKIEFEKKNLVVYRYNISISVTLKDNRIIEFARREECPRLENRNSAAVNSILRTYLKKQNTTDLSYRFVHDAFTTMYGLDSSLNNVQFDIDSAAISRKHKPTFGGEDLAYVTVKFTVEKRFVINGDQQEDVDDSVETCQFLDTLASALILRNTEFDFLQGAFFHKSAAFCYEDEINDIFALRTGVTRKAQFDRHNRAYALQFSIATKLFFRKNIRLVEFLKHFLNIKSDQELVMILSTEVTPKLFIGITCFTTHLEEKKVVRLKQFHAKNAATTKMPGSNLTVQQYYAKKYDVDVDPFFPLVTDEYEYYYPIDILQIDHLQKLDSKFNVSTEYYMSSPQKYLEEMKFFIDLAQFDSRNAYLSAFGVTIANQMPIMEATLIQRPILEFENECIDVSEESNEFVNHEGLFFKCGASFPKTAVLFPMMLKGRIRDVKIALLQLATRALHRGMNQTSNLVEAKVIPLNDTYETSILLDKMHQLRSDDVKFVILISNKSDEELHSILKFVEQQTGVFVQHLPIQAITYDSISLTSAVMKMNLIFGGINYFIHANNFENADNIVNRLLESTMFIGLHILQPEAETNSDLLGCLRPAVVGMAYTLNNPTEKRGLYWFQLPKERNIKNLHQKILNALESYINVMKVSPERIVIFRNDIPTLKAFFEKVNVQSEIRDVLARLDLNCPVYHINVDMENSVRMLRSDIVTDWANSLTNLPAGTCLIKDGTNTAEAIVISQEGITGISLPILVTLMHKTPEAPMLTSRQLAWLANALAYSHSAAENSIRIPSPLMAAINLARQGNEILSVKMNDDAQLFSTTTEFDDNMCRVLSEELAAKFMSSQFWA